MAAPAEQGSSQQEEQEPNVDTRSGNQTVTGSRQLDEDLAWEEHRFQPKD
jgi:hypothetical protein